MDFRGVGVGELDFKLGSFVSPHELGLWLLWTPSQSVLADFG